MFLNGISIRVGKEACCVELGLLDNWTIIHKLFQGVVIQWIMDPEWNSCPSYCLPFGVFYFVNTSFHFHFFLIVFFCSFAFSHSWCSHAVACTSVWGNTCAWVIEFHILKSIFAWFPEQLLKGLVSWGSYGKYYTIDCFLGDASWFCPASFGVLFCSVVLNSWYTP